VTFVANCGQTAADSDMVKVPKGSRLAVGQPYLLLRTNFGKTFRLATDGHNIVP